MTPGMTELFLSAFVTLFVVIDPPGCAPIYAGLTKGATPAQAGPWPARACAIATAILLVFALFGQQLLAALHIELDSFRIAGGIMLFLIALDMVFEKRTQRREERAEKVAAQSVGKAEVEDVSVFPMAMPMLAGPGAIAAVMLLRTRRRVRRNPSPGPWRAGCRYGAHLAGAGRRQPADEAARRKGGSGHHPPARRAAGGARAQVRDRWNQE
jgi:MarC family membrane protein